MTPDATECVRAFVNVLRGLEFADESIKSALEEVAGEHR